MKKFDFSDGCVVFIKTLAGIGLFAAVLVLAVSILSPPMPTPAPQRERISAAVTRSGDEDTVVVFMHGSGEKREMPFEEYIIGSVAAEMPALYDIEALKAQAVCSRTFAVNNIASGGCGRCEGADVCTDFGHCQAYIDEAGMRELWGDGYDEYHAKITAAVLGTAGMVMVYDGKPVKALYHSVSGGRTEDAENVFSESLPYLRSVDSPGEEQSPGFHGEVSLPLDSAASAINAAYPSALVTGGGLAGSVEILSRFESGRVNKCRLGGVVLSGTEVRKLFSLNSARFDIRFSGGNIIFTTTGKGHGVGMSQTGANALAGAGESWEGILLHYYTGVSLRNYQGG